MTKPVANPTRLSGLPESQDALGVGRLFRNARELPDEDLPRLRWRLRTSQRMRALRPRLYLKVALVVGVVFCLGGVVGAVVSPYWIKKEPGVGVSPTPGKARAAKAPRPRKPIASPATGAGPEASVGEAEPGAEPTKPSVAPEPTPAASGPERIAPEATPAAAQPRSVAREPQPALAPANPRAAVRVAVARTPTPSPAPSRVPAVTPAPAPPSGIANEQALLGQAMRTLRAGRDARGALALLAQHAERFPSGVLTSEATMLRIEALLALGRQDEALSALDRVPLASLPNRAEQLVVRGELRAGAGRWREAKQDFDESLRDRGLAPASAKAASLQERALWGRAAARSRLGDQDGARADLQLYLRSFPGGRFAGPAASLLEAMP